MKKLIATMMIIATTAVLHASPDGYVMLALHSPGELPVPASSINGGRLSVIYGDCQNLNGLDVGLAGRVREHMNGLEINALYSLVGTEFNGLQIGIINFNDAESRGCQLGLGNIAGVGVGFQAGIVNVAGYFAGCQLGVFNWADTMAGCQIGLVNVIADQCCPVLPILNVGW